MSPGRSPRAPRRCPWVDRSKPDAVRNRRKIEAADPRRRGFAVLGSTTVDAHMQATGMVHDPALGCFRRAAVRALAAPGAATGRPRRPAPRRT